MILKEDPLMDFTISLSITNKNLDLFEKFKQRQNSFDKDFVEIKIDPLVLLDNECFFCRTNAANQLSMNIERILKSLIY